MGKDFGCWQSRSKGISTPVGCPPNSVVNLRPSTPKLVLITGATRGLGRAMTGKFAELGHIVVGCGRSRNEIATLARQFPKPHDFEIVDVSSDSQVGVWAARLLSSHGPPDLILNNAAVVNRNAPLWKVSADEFSSVMDVNIKGTANVIRHFVPSMIERKRGVIVNFSSGWGRSVSPEVAPYCASKWAVEGLTRALADELPSGMAAVPLNPGVIDTEMLRSCFGAAAASYPNPGEWAGRAVPFLLKIGAKDNGKPLSVPG
ncbi:MAG: SDR family oxidoreductase [Verrucomicrobia bacterium]|nr:SDR family oxidoreductase [Verrucomicrobiota bacterium]